MYTVRSGYHVAQSMARQVGRNVVEGGWMKIWRMQVPPRIKLFVWKACMECFPSIMNLYKRGIPLQPICVLCEEGDESTMHLFTECRFVQECWRRLDPNITRGEEQSFKIWFFKHMENRDSN